MASSLAKLVKARDLPITMRHEKWMKIPDYRRPWSDEALAFAQRVLSGEVGGKRLHRTPYRASGTGKCVRARHFSAEGLKRTEIIDTALFSKFMTGDFGHLKWQMMGITEGWLIGAEIPVEFGLLSGTMDGEIYDGSIFEFKTINDNGFKNVIAYGADPLHVRQSHAYMLCSEKDSASIVYENKNDQDWVEIRVHRDEAIIEEIRTELDNLHIDTSLKVLPEPLSGCIDQTGSTYRNCPFRLSCLDIYKWEDMNDHKSEKSNQS